MSKTKCRNCGLVNASHDMTCRRCGEWMGGNRASRTLERSPREAAKKSTWLYTLLFIAVLFAAADYLYKGVERSFEEVSAGEPNRIASHPKDQSTGSTNRTEADRQQVSSYKNAIQNAPALAESNKRVAETQKLMRPEQSKQ